VLTATFHVESNVPYLLGPPGHAGTSAFLLVAVLLIDRAPAGRFAPPLLCAKSRLSGSPEWAPRQLAIYV
jgi:hypothetical protein